MARYLSILSTPPLATDCIFRVSRQISRQCSSTHPKTSHSSRSKSSITLAIPSALCGKARTLAWSPWRLGSPPHGGSGCNFSRLHYRPTPILASVVRCPMAACCRVTLTLSLVQTIGQTTPDIRELPLGQIPVNSGPRPYDKLAREAISEQVSQLYLTILIFCADSGIDTDAHVWFYVRLS